MSIDSSLYADTAARIFAAHCPQSVIEQSEQGAFPAGMWSELTDAGLFAMMAADSDADLEDVAAVIREAGRYAAPGPILETIIGNRLLSAVAQPLSSRLALCVADGSAVRLEGDRLEVSEMLGSVVWPSEVDELLLLVSDSANATLFALHAADHASSQMISLTGEPAGRFRSGTHHIRAGFQCDLALAASVRRELDILNAARISGALAWMIERSVDYAHERRQFGRELAQLQSVQQQLALAAGEFAATDAIVRHAARATGDAGETAALAARSRCADAIDGITAICHQIHGAIGFSREYALNFRTRRLFAWRDEWRDSVAARQALGRILLRHEAGPWAAITGAP